MTAQLKTTQHWYKLNEAQKKRFIDEEFGEAGRNILAVAKKHNAHSSVFAILEYRALGYVQHPAQSQINSAKLIEKAKEDLIMLNAENGLQGADSVRFKELVVAPRYIDEEKRLDYGITLSFGNVDAVNLYRFVLCRDGVFVLTVVGAPEDRLKLEDFSIEVPKGKRYEDYQAGRDQIFVGDLSNLILMNRFI